MVENCALPLCSTRSRKSAAKLQFNAKINCSADCKREAEAGSGVRADAGVVADQPAAGAGSSHDYWSFTCAV